MSCAQIPRLLVHGIMQVVSTSFPHHQIINIYDSRVSDVRHGSPAICFISTSCIFFNSIQQFLNGHVIQHKCDVCNVQPRFPQMIYLLLRPMLIQALFDLQNSQKARISLFFDKLFCTFPSNSQQRIQPFRRCIHNNSGAPFVDAFHNLTQPQFCQYFNLRRFLIILQIPDRIYFLRLFVIFF